MRALDSSEELERIADRLRRWGFRVTADLRTDEHGAAALTGFKRATLRKLRVGSDGPAFVIVRRSVWYCLGDVLAWLQGPAGYRRIVTPGQLMSESFQRLNAVAGKTSATLSDAERRTLLVAVDNAEPAAQDLPGETDLDADA